MRRLVSFPAPVNTAAALAVLFLSACTTTIQPPGFYHKNGDVQVAFPPDVSAETRYVLTRWFLETYRDHPQARGLAQAEQVYLAAGKTIVAQQAERLATAYPLWLRDAGGGRLALSLEAAASATNLSETTSRLRQLIGDLKAPITVVPVATECLSDACWGSTNDALRNEFVAWLKDKQFVLSLPDEAGRADMVAALQRCIAALEAQQHIEETVARAVGFEEAGEPEKAFDLLSRLRLKHDLFADAQAGPGLADHGRRVDQHMASLAARWVAEKLEDIQAHRLPQLHHHFGGLERSEDLTEVLQFLRAEEQYLSDTLRAWQANAHLNAAVLEQTAAFAAIAGHVAALRGRLWQRELAMLVDARKYWEAYQCFRRQYAEAEDLDADLFAAYAFSDVQIRQRQLDLPTCRHKLLSESRQQYVQMLPEVFKLYLELANREVNNSLRHGVSIGLCLMLDKMAELAGHDALLREPTDLLAEAKARYEGSTVFFARHFGERAIIVQEFDAGISGLGKTFAADLAQGLKALLVETPAGRRLVTVAEKPSEIRARDYLVQNGNVADFSAEDAPTLRSVRTVHRWGAIHEHDNPGAVQDAANPDNTGQDPRPARYSQPLLEHVIRVATSERIAHVRVTFELRHLGTDRFIEINHFFRKRFVQEETHPFTDTREIRTKRAANREELKPEEPMPELRNERPWTSSEMLDRARQEAQTLMRLRIMREVASYPLLLAAQAEAAAAEGKWAEAANQWGFCYEYCRGPQLPLGTLGPDSDEESPPEYLGEEIRANERLRQQLAEVRDAAEEKMIAAVLRFLSRTDAQ